jgi:3-hydroxybutyryl-CoA dehydrogenase
MAIKKVFVIGAGQMGNGIAQVSAQAGYDVMMSDIKEEFIQKGMATIEKSLDRLVKKETIKESDKAAILARIKTTVDNKDAKDADMVIEAAP